MATFTLSNFVGLELRFGFMMIYRLCLSNLSFPKKRLEKNFNLKNRNALAIPDDIEKVYAVTFSPLASKRP